MNKVLLVGRLTRDPELRTLPSGKQVANFVVATNEYRGGGAAERTEYHNLVAWDRLAEICGQFLSKGQLIDVEGRLQTRQWDDDAGVRHWKTEVVSTRWRCSPAAARRSTPRRRRPSPRLPTSCRLTPPTENGAAAEATWRQSSPCDPSGGGAHPPASSPDQSPLTGAPARCPGSCRPGSRSTSWPEADIRWARNDPQIRHAPLASG